MSMCLKSDKNTETNLNSLFNFEMITFYISYFFCKFLKNIMLCTVKKDHINSRFKYSISHVSLIFVQGRLQWNSVFFLQTIYLKKTFKTLNIAIMRLGGFASKDTYSALMFLVLFLTHCKCSCNICWFNSAYMWNDVSFHLWTTPHNSCLQIPSQLQSVQENVTHLENCIHYALMPFWNGKKCKSLSVHTLLYISDSFFYFGMASNAYQIVIESYFNKQIIYLKRTALLHVDNNC